MTKDKYQLNNETVMNSDEALSYIKEYFANYFKKHSLVESYFNPAGYWGVRYKHNADEIFISSGRGYLELELTTNEQKIIVNEAIPEVAELKSSSKENIAFLLNRLAKLYAN
jgi:hypothetical protein